MKKIILLFLMAVAMATSAFSEKRAVPMRTHQNGENSEYLTGVDRHPITLPIAVYYDSETNTLEVRCDDDNILAEVFVYDEAGAVEAYSPYMNVSLTLTSSNSHAILLIGNGWEAESKI